MTKTKGEMLRVRSMTGFAQSRCIFKDYELNIEIRSLNHRFLECVTHLPEGMGLLEDVIKGQVTSRLARGRVTVVVSVVNHHPKVSVDYALADSYARTLKQLNRKLKLENHLGLNQIINQEGILKIERPAVTTELMGAVKNLVNKALEKLTIIRSREGRALAGDILRHISTITKEAEKIDLFLKASLRQKEKKMPEAEYSVFLKNTDISEELTRIRYHVKNSLATIKRSSSCGKELDFIAQEIQREANTITAKAQDARVSSSVIKIKSAVDKIREQVQNIE